MTSQAETRRVLVTGASGFIGRHCLDSLVSRGFEVHCVSRARQVETTAGIHWYQADVLDFAEIHRLVAQVQPTHLLHLAWDVEPGKYWTSPENIRWLQASLELLRVFAAQGGQRLVMAGTCAEYDLRYGYCHEAITPTLPATLYGACKLALQQIVQVFADREGLSAAWGRIFFLYGPYEHPDRVVAYVIRSLRDGIPAAVSHGNQIRDFLHVQDVAGAFTALLERDIRGVVNIASGEPIMLKALFHKIGVMIGCPDLIQYGARVAPADEPPLIVGDAQRLRNELGWQPAYTLDQGLSQTIDWWAAHTKEENR